MPHEYRKIAWIAICLLIFANIGLWTRVKATDGLEVSFLNVGQGDSAYIKTPNGVDVLIDGGPSSGVLSELGKVMSPFDKTIDLVVISHPDKDHIGGLPSVFDNFEIKTVMQTNNTSESNVFKELSEKIKIENARIIEAKKGLEIVLNEKQKIYLKVLHPDKDYSESNDSSVVLTLVFGDSEFLFTGDAGINIEEVILSSNEILKSDVLKIAHHGSKNSSSDKFLTEVRPIYSIISVGPNSYGHPDDGVLSTLSSIGSKILRTDKEKTIRFLSDGFSVREI